MHKVKCFYCGNTFDRDKEEFSQVQTKRYAHKSCHEEHESKKTQEEKDEENLRKYIKKLFNISTIPQKINKQIEKFVKENNYSYSGIERSLIYFYEIKGNSLDKSNGGIGIVPWVYDDAWRYYYSIWQAKQKQDYVITNQIDSLIPQEEIVIITTPQRKPKKRQIFTFLDETFEEEQ